MKLAPVSTDLLIKLALVAGGVGLAWYLWRQASGRLSDAAGAAARVFDDVSGAVGDVADAVIVGTNPVNPENWANRAVNAVGSAVVSDSGPGRNADGGWNLGSWWFDVTNPGWMSAALATSAAPAPAQWGSEARRNQPIFGAESEELTDWSQLSSLGAP